jgi:hypothetical protein
MTTSSNDINNINSTLTKDNRININKYNHSNFLFLLRKSMGSSSQGTKGRLIDRSMASALPSDSSEKLTSRERSRKRLEVLRDAG